MLVLNSGQRPNVSISSYNDISTVHNAMKDGVAFGNTSTNPVIRKQVRDIGDTHSINSYEIWKTDDGNTGVSNIDYSKILNRVYPTSTTFTTGTTDYATALSTTASNIIVSDNPNNDGVNFESDTRLELLSYDYFVLVNPDNTSTHHFAKITKLLTVDDYGDAFEFEPAMASDITIGTKYEVFKGPSITETNIVALAYGLRGQSDVSHTFLNDDVYIERFDRYASVSRPIFYFYNDRLNNKNELDHDTKYKLVCSRYITALSQIGSITVNDASLPSGTFEGAATITLSADPSSHLTQGQSVYAVDDFIGNYTSNSGADITFSNLHHIPANSEVIKTGIDHFFSVFKTEPEYGNFITDNSKFSYHAELIDVLRNKDEAKDKDGVATGSGAAHDPQEDAYYNTDEEKYDFDSRFWALAFRNYKRSNEDRNSYDSGTTVANNGMGAFTAYDGANLTGPKRYTSYISGKQPITEQSNIISYNTSDSITNQSSFVEANILDYSRTCHIKIRTLDDLKIREPLYKDNTTYVTLPYTATGTSGNSYFTLNSVSIDNNLFNTLDGEIVEIGNYFYKIAVPKIDSGITINGTTAKGGLSSSFTFNVNSDPTGVIDVKDKIYVISYGVYYYVGEVDAITSSTISLTATNKNSLTSGTPIYTENPYYDSTNNNVVAKINIVAHRIKTAKTFTVAAALQETITTASIKKHNWSNNETYFFNHNIETEYNYNQSRLIKYGKTIAATDSKMRNISLRLIGSNNFFNSILNIDYGDNIDKYVKILDLPTDSYLPTAVNNTTPVNITAGNLNKPNYLNYFLGGTVINNIMFEGLVEKINTEQNDVGLLHFTIEGRDKIADLLSLELNRDYAYLDDYVYSTQTIKPNAAITTIGNPLASPSSTVGLADFTYGSAQIDTDVPVATELLAKKGDKIYYLLSSGNWEFVGEVDSVDSTGTNHLITLTNKVYFSATDETIGYEPNTYNNLIAGKSLSSNIQATTKPSSLKSSADKGLLFTSGKQFNASSTTNNYYSTDSGKLLGELSATGGIDSDGTIGYHVRNPLGIEIEKDSQHYFQLADESIISTNTNTLHTVSSMSEYIIDKVEKNQIGGSIISIAPTLPVFLGRIDANTSDTRLTNSAGLYLSNTQGLPQGGYVHLLDTRLDIYPITLQEEIIDKGSPIYRYIDLEKGGGIKYAARSNSATRGRNDVYTNPKGNQTSAKGYASSVRVNASATNQIQAKALTANRISNKSYSVHGSNFANFSYPARSSATTLVQGEALEAGEIEGGHTYTIQDALDLCRPSWDICDPSTVNLQLFGLGDIFPESMLRYNHLGGNSTNVFTDYSIILKEEGVNSQGQTHNEYDGSLLNSTKDDNNFEQKKISDSNITPNNMVRWGIIKLVESTYDWHFNAIDVENLSEDMLDEKELVNNFDYERVHLDTCLDSGIIDRSGNGTKLDIITWKTLGRDIYKSYAYYKTNANPPIIPEDDLRINMTKGWLAGQGVEITGKDTGGLLTSVFGAIATLSGERALGDDEKIFTSPDNRKTLNFGPSFRLLDGDRPTVARNRDRATLSPFDDINQDANINVFTHACATVNTNVAVTFSSSPAIVIGLKVSGTGIPPNAIVASVGSGTFNLSIAATATNDPVTLTFNDGNNVYQDNKTTASDGTEEYYHPSRVMAGLSVNNRQYGIIGRSIYQYCNFLFMGDKIGKAFPQDRTKTSGIYWGATVFPLRTVDDSSDADTKINHNFEQINIVKNTTAIGSLDVAFANPFICVKDGLNFYTSEGTFSEHDSDLTNDDIEHDGADAHLAENAGKDAKYRLSRTLIKLYIELELSSGAASHNGITYTKSGTGPYKLEIETNGSNDSHQWLAFVDLTGQFIVSTKGTHFGIGTASATLNTVESDIELNGPFKGGYVPDMISKIISHEVAISGGTITHTLEFDKEITNGVGGTPTLYFKIFRINHRTLNEGQEQINLFVNEPKNFEEYFTSAPKDNKSGRRLDIMPDSSLGDRSRTNEGLGEMYLPINIDTQTYGSDNIIKTTLTEFTKDSTNTTFSYWSTIANNEAILSDGHSSEKISYDLSSPHNAVGVQFNKKLKNDYFGCVSVGHIFKISTGTPIKLNRAKTANIGTAFKIADEAENLIRDIATENNIELNNSVSHFKYSGILAFHITEPQQSSYLYLEPDTSLAAKLKVGDNIYTDDFKPIGRITVIDTANNRLTLSTNSAYLTDVYNYTELLIKTPVPFFTGPKFEGQNGFTAIKYLASLKSLTPIIENSKLKLLPIGSEMNMSDVLLSQDNKNLNIISVQMGKNIFDYANTVEVMGSDVKVEKSKPHNKKEDGKKIMLKETYPFINTISEAGRKAADLLEIHSKNDPRITIKLSKTNVEYIKAGDSITLHFDAHGIEKKLYTVLEIRQGIGDVVEYDFGSYTKNISERLGEIINKQKENISQITGSTVDESRVDTEVVAGFTLETKKIIIKRESITTSASFSTTYTFGIPTPTFGFNTTSTTYTEVDLP